MRFIIMHKTDAHWEAGALPSAELIGRVSALLGELAQEGVLHAAEGLRPSSEGVRLRFKSGVRTIARGPFERGNEHPVGFSILRAASLEDAIDWASRQPTVFGDVEIDIRPVTEPWDIGMSPRPAGAETRRYIALQKASAETEVSSAPSPAQHSVRSRPIDETTPAAVHLVTETMRPSARGRRYKNATNGISVVDGPFTESKELIGGYVIVAADSLEDAGRLAERYIEAVQPNEVDLLELV